VISNDRPSPALGLLGILASFSHRALHDVIAGAPLELILWTERIKWDSKIVCLQILIPISAGTTNMTLQPQRGNVTNIVR